MLFVMCTDKSAWLFPYARELLRKTAQPVDSEEREEDDEIQAALQLPSRHPVLGPALHGRHGSRGPLRRSSGRRRGPQPGVAAARRPPGHCRGGEGAG
ncbi:unnamed protein product, partial [Prorocentrum cordatum]